MSEQSSFMPVVENIKGTKFADGAPDGKHYWLTPPALWEQLVSLRLRSVPVSSAGGLRRPDVRVGQEQLRQPAVRVHPAQREEEDGEYKQVDWRSSPNTREERE